MLTPGFQFHQANLQDFQDCRRRFYLRYVLRLAWPSVEAEPILEHERNMLRGARFHRLAQQHFLGVPEDLLAASIRDAELQSWWGNFLNLRSQMERDGICPPLARFFAEVTLSTPLEGFRLVAKLDLLVVAQEGRLTIYDWKTSSQPVSGRRRSWLKQRWQTRVYPYVVSNAVGKLLHSRVSPDQIEMMYWFAAFPEQPERFAYDVTQHQSDEEDLKRLAGLISRLEGEEDFPMTADEKHCRFCIYRSLCERGVRAAYMGEEDEAEMEDDFQSRFDFTEAEEIAAPGYF